MATNVCFDCGRAIRDWETGYESTGLCEECQVDAEKQAERDNEAIARYNAAWNAPHARCMVCGADVEGPIWGPTMCAACADERDFKHGTGRYSDPFA